MSRLATRTRLQRRAYCGFGRTVTNAANASVLRFIGAKVLGYALLTTGLSLALLPSYLARILLFPELPIALAPLVGLSPLSAGGLIYVVVHVLQVALLLMLVRYWERQPWTSVGFKKISLRDGIIGLVAWFVAIRIAMVSARINWSISAIGPSVAASLSDHNSPWVLGHGFGLVFITAGTIAEELGSRAYVIERFTALTGRIWFAGCISLLASTVMHIPAWGTQGALSRASTLLVFVLLYMWRRNLFLSILTHLLMNMNLFILIFVVTLPAPIRSWLLYIIM
jgi:membrane protease YdiL (CAAX protease family)